MPLSADETEAFSPSCAEVRPLPVQCRAAKLEAACKITPGKRAPTINSLEEQGWVAVSAMVNRKGIAVAMDQLTALGACDILVMKIDNSRTAP